MFFHDWRYVHHGSTVWLSESGENPGLWVPAKTEDYHWAGTNIPRGIELKVKKAVKSGPIIEPDKPWEGMLHAPSLIFDQGKYRLWYESVPPVDMEAFDAGMTNLLCYAESADAEEWVKPNLGAMGYQGAENTNIVYGGELTSKTGYHGGSVFLDPGCDISERFKLIHLGYLSRDDYESYMQKEGMESDPHNEKRDEPRAVFGGVSPDGINWTPLDEPLVLQMSDTQNVAYYDTHLRRYVAYLRTWVMGKRSIGRTESRKFGRFPLPETFLWPDLSVGPSDLWYANGKTTYPDADDYHLLFPKKWRLSEDRFYVYMSTSPDGIMWGPPRPVLEPGEEWDYGGVDVGPGMVNLPGERLGVPFVGYEVPHKYPRSAPLGKIALAHWERGRLVGLEAKERGSFSTVLLRLKGQEVHVNLKTSKTGEFRIGISDKNGIGIAGRTIADCDPITGNHLDKLVTWHGSSNIEEGDEHLLRFRVVMDQAELFALRFI